MEFFSDWFGRTNFTKVERCSVACWGHVNRGHWHNLKSWAATRHQPSIPYPLPLSPFRVAADRSLSQHHWAEAGSILGRSPVHNSADIQRQAITHAHIQSYGQFQSHQSTKVAAQPCLPTMHQQKEIFVPSAFQIEDTRFNNQFKSPAVDMSWKLGVSYKVNVEYILFTLKGWL